MSRALDIEGLTGGPPMLREDILVLVAQDLCPVMDCGGVLDTGWECLRCKFDAELIAVTLGGPAQ